MLKIVVAFSYLVKREHISLLELQGERKMPWSALPVHWPYERITSLQGLNVWLATYHVENERAHYFFERKYTKNERTL